MKTTLKILILISTILTSSIVAQDTTKTQTSLIIKTDIFMPIYSLATNYKAGSLTVEFGVKRQHSLQITLVTQVLLHFLRVNAQMCNLTKQKTAQGLKTLGTTL
jgi:hypothetical protein